MTTDGAFPTHPRLKVEQDGPALTLTLAAPEVRNAQVPSLWGALESVATTLPPGVRVVVLRGDGPAFSAGLDRGMLAPGGIEGEEQLISPDSSPEAVADRIQSYQRGFTAWQECPALVVAAVQGPAIGAGFQLALAADLRIVATDVMFKMAEVSLGLVPDLSGTVALTRIVGASRALELCLTGRAVGAQEALATGIANRVVEPEALSDAVNELVTAVLSTPEAASREVVGLFRGIEQRSAQEQLRAEREAQTRRLIDLAGSRTAR